MSEADQVEKMVDRFLTLAAEVGEAKDAFADDFRLDLSDMYTIVDLARLIKDRELMPTRQQMQGGNDDAN